MIFFFRFSFLLKNFDHLLYLVLDADRQEKRESRTRDQEDYHVYRPPDQSNGTRNRTKPLRLQTALIGIWGYIPQTVRGVSV